MPQERNMNKMSPISGITYFVSIPLYQSQKNPPEEMLYWLLNQSSWKLEYVSIYKFLWEVMNETIKKVTHGY